MAFDPVHARWAIDQRAKIQHTLLTLYQQLDVLDPEVVPFALSEYIDDLIAAAFSLWRAVFLADNLRVLPDVKDAQKKFLEKVVATNAITFGDDVASNQWSYGYYLFNAFYRLKNARHLAGSLLANDDTILDYCFGIHRIASPAGNRYQWELMHTALRTAFNCLEDAPTLVVEMPAPIENDPFYNRSFG